MTTGVEERLSRFGVDGRPDLLSRARVHRRRRRRRRLATATVAVLAFAGVGAWAQPGGRDSTDVSGVATSAPNEPRDLFGSFAGYEATDIGGWLLRRPATWLTTVVERPCARRMAGMIDK